MKKKKVVRSVVIKEPCLSCPQLKKFSFEGCAASCLKLFERSKEVIKPNDSPCRDLRCGLPGAKENCPHREKCLWLKAYRSMPTGESGIKSALGKEPDRVNASWEEWQAWREKRY